MSLVEAIIIYLSAGAPFGVLVFFSKRTSIRAAVSYSLVATIAWPIVGTQRLYRSLARRKDRPQTVGEISEIKVLQRLADEVPAETAELFEIAGHPNPWLATNCYARARKKVIGSHIDRLVATSPSITEEFEITQIPEYSTAVTSTVGS